MVPLTNPDWIARFVERLSRLRPAMSAVTAAALGIEAHRHEPEGTPEQAAEHFHRDHPGPSGEGVDARTLCWSTSLYDSMEHERTGYPSDAPSSPF